jgi:type III secretion protein V
MNSFILFVEKTLGRAKQSSDIVLAVVMAAIIGALIVPLPAFVVDIGLAINLAASLSLLVAALYAKDALKVATFPTLLLLTTLFRLAMNVSSTRLALSEGHAGEVIQAFGEFVVRGDYVVGGVLFAILTLVQFLVVAKGAERVAEVSARFTLDAMPGKQMSIDADLRAGAITQEQARARRRELERESQLFGSMDGAMKFVKGDVIAGLVITLINLIGGTLIGILQNGQTASEAISTYALISIGDGLVSQIPSLCIAVAAGLVVTRVASEKENTPLGSDIGAQFFGQYKALFVVSGLSVAIGSMPGMPHITFLVIAGLMASVGFALKKMEKNPAPVVNKEQNPNQPASSVESAGESESPNLDFIHAVTPLMLDVPKDLMPMLEANAQAFVKTDLNTVRERVFLEMGVKIPAFRVRTGAPIPSRSWALFIDELPAGKAQLPQGEYFVFAGVTDLAASGVATQHVGDIAGRSVMSFGFDGKEKIESMGYQTKSMQLIAVEQLVWALKKKCQHFLGVQEVQAALTTLEQDSGALVKEALQKVPLPLMTDVLKRLLAEQVSVRNLRAILEALVAPTTEGDAATLAEKCRAALARQISHQHSGNGALFAYLVDPSVEETLREQGQGIEPSAAGAILEGVKRIARQGKVVLLASPDVRRLLKKLIEGAFPEVAVLTFSELDPELQVRPVGRLVSA